MTKALDFLKSSGFKSEWIEKEGKIAVLILGNYGSATKEVYKTIEDLVEEFLEEDNVVEWVVGRGDDLPNAMCLEEGFDESYISDKARVLFKTLAGLDMFKEKRSDQETEE